MIHSLCFSEFCNGGKDSKGITGEEDDVGGVVCDAGDLCVVNEVDWVGSARVLSE